MAVCPARLLERCPAIDRDCVFVFPLGDPDLPGNLSMGADIGLVALWGSYPAPTPDAPPHVRWGGWLFGLGVAAGIIMLLLRFTSEHAWWTGHLRGGGF